MKKAGIKRFMESIGCSADTPTRIKEIRTINLRSDGNQSITPENDEITFDMDNELIKIKEYDATLVSGIVSIYEIAGNELRNCRFSTSLKFNMHPIPKIGDTIVYISKKDGSYKAIGKVTDILSKTLTIDSDFPDAAEYVIGYVDSTEYATASQYLRDPRFFVKYTPVTDFDTDIYIDFFAVVGFSAVSSYYGI